MRSFSQRAIAARRTGGTSRPSKVRILRAIPKSGGLLSKIARKANIPTSTLNKLIARSGWQEIREAIQEERDRTLDTAQDTVHTAITQRDDMSLALRAAQYYLDRLHPDFKKQASSASPPIKIDIRTISPIVLSKLPLDARRILLEEMEGETKLLPPPIVIDQVDD